MHGMHICHDRSSTHGAVLANMFSTAAPSHVAVDAVLNRGQRVTNRIQFGWLGLQLQASGPLTVLNSSR
jgi:hypothetical protein